MYVRQIYKNVYQSLDNNDCSWNQLLVEFPRVKKRG